MNEIIKKKTKIDFVMQFIQDQINNKTLIPGAKLISVRQLASKLNLSISTIVEAYARLVSEGAIEARKGAGYFVSTRIKPVLILQAPTQYNREIDPLWISRQSLSATDGAIKAGCGWLPAPWMPDQTIRKALKAAAKSSIETLIDYPTPNGHIGLRQLIARKNENYELNLQLDQILITDSATQSIDLIFRLLLNPGDIILIDDPCYFNFLALINVHHLQAISIPFTACGPDLISFEQALSLQPKLYITNSGIHNPTGMTLSLKHAHQVAKMAEQANLMIVEDDIFAEFEYTPAPRYSSLMELSNVIQIGSFSKTLSASVRCGYIATDLNKIEQLIDLKIATNFSSGQLNAEIIFQALSDPSYRKHIETLRHRLLKIMNETILRLAELDIHVENIPKAGIFLWTKLPHGISASEVSKICLKHGVVLAPGSAFSQSPLAPQYLRFNVAQSYDPKVYQVLSHAMQILKNQKHSMLD